LPAANNDETESPPTAGHENIRGGDYYY